MVVVLVSEVVPPRPPLKRTQFTSFWDTASLQHTHGAGWHKYGTPHLSSVPSPVSFRLVPRSLPSTDELCPSEHSRYMKPSKRSYPQTSCPYCFLHSTRNCQARIRQQHYLGDVTSTRRPSLATAWQQHHLAGPSVTTRILPTISDFKGVPRWKQRPISFRLRGVLYAI